MGGAHPLPEPPAPPRVSCLRVQVVTYLNGEKHNFPFALGSVVLLFVRMCTCCALDCTVACVHGCRGVWRFLK
jgi:hypothetical protein